MRFQGLAVVLGKKRWLELIARQRKKDLGLDAYAPVSLTPQKIGQGLAASITSTLKKVSGDTETAKEIFPDLKKLLFATSAKVGNADRKKWEEAIQKDHGGLNRQRVGLGNLTPISERRPSASSPRHSTSGRSG